MGYSIPAMLLLLVGWATTISSLIISLVKSYPAYSRFNPKDFVFYEPDELKNDTNINKLYYVIKNSSDLLLNIANLNKSECTLVSKQAYDKIVSFVDNFVIIIAYFVSISLMILSEVASTFIFIKKLRTNDKDYGKKAKWAIFIVKTNFIIGTFTIAIIDFDLECFQLKVSEFFIEVAYYSIIVFMISLAVGVFILLFVTFLFGYGCTVGCGSVCCGCDVDKSFDCFAGKKFIVFLVFLSILVVLLELANIAIYVILFLGPKIAQIINALMTVSLGKDIVQIFYCCWIFSDLFRNSFGLTFFLEKSVKVKSWLWIFKFLI